MGRPKIIYRLVFGLYIVRGNAGSSPSGLNWLGGSFRLVYFEKIRVFKAGLSIMP